MSLRQRVEKYIKTGSGELEQLLEECARLGGAEGLACVTRLFEDMYGGHTFNMELKAPAAWELVVWGEAGLDELVKAAKTFQTSKNRSLCIDVLAAVAAGSACSDKPAFCSKTHWDRLSRYLARNPGLPSYAREKLVEFILSMDDENDVIGAAAAGFSTQWYTAESPLRAKELFSAISARWLSTSETLLETYQRMLTENATDETAFQRFFTDHPQMLDPLAVEVWPQPNLHGARRPDFVVRRFDDSYVVVEIETPAKLLITSDGQLSSWATHAVAQVLEYRRFVEKLPAVQTHFPGLDNVDCLAVVGMESKLDAHQKQALRNDNRQRHALKLCGFDWLLNNARSIKMNLIRNGVEIRKIRVI